MRRTTTRRTRRRQIRCLSAPSKVQLGGQTVEDARDTAADVRLDLAGAHQHHLLVHLVHLVVQLDQVEFGDLNNTVMLRTASGISECLPSTVQFVLWKHHEMSVARFSLCVCRAGDNGRRMRATTHLALQPDFGVFLTSLRAASYCKRQNTQFQYPRTHVQLIRSSSPSPAASCPVELAAKAPETCLNPAAAPALRS